MKIKFGLSSCVYLCRVLWNVFSCPMKIKSWLVVNVNTSEECLRMDQSSSKAAAGMMMSEVAGLPIVAFPSGRPSSAVGISNRT